MQDKKKEINNIANFLKKFKIFTPFEKKVKDNFIKIVKEICNFKIDYKKIKINGKNISLSISPVMKSEIFLKKSKILEKMKEELNIDFSIL